MKLAAEDFWGRVIAHSSSPIVCKKLYEFKKLKTAVLHDHFKKMDKEEWAKILKKGVGWHELCLWEDMARIFSDLYWIPFVEQEGNKVTVFVCEIVSFLQTGKPPPKLYGGHVKSSIEYYNRRLKEVTELRKKIVNSRRRQVKRDKIKMSATTNA